MEESEELLHQAIKLAAILDDFIRDCHVRRMDSGEWAWRLIQVLSDLRLENLKGKSDPG